MPIPSDWEILGLFCSCALYYLCEIPKPLGSPSAGSGDVQSMHWQVAA